METRLINLAKTEGNRGQLEGKYVIVIIGINNN